MYELIAYMRYHFQAEPWVYRTMEDKFTLSVLFTTTYLHTNAVMMAGSFEPMPLHEVLEMARRHKVVILLLQSFYRHNTYGIKIYS